MQLSQSQSEAVNYVQGPCIISAGPGSGKTFTITHKFANLVSTHGINPGRILCITFTNKASEELKNRLHNLLQIDYLPWVRTIHSACLQLVKPYVHTLGYDSNFTIATGSKSRGVIKSVLNDLRITTKDGNIGKMMQMVSRSKDYPNPVKHIQENFAAIPQAREIYVRYQEILQENNFLDFDDILHHVYFLFKHDEQFRNETRSMFDYVLVDEYQDVNNIQYLIIKQLGNNITVVGDDYQSIYAFRGSDPKYFINFHENYENSHTVRLEENYRSIGGIVDLSQSIIDKNKNQLHKKCFSQLSTKIKPKVVHFDNEYKEIEAIVAACKKYIAEGFNLDEIAILYRIKMASRVVEQEFNRHGIPHKIVNDVSFFERREIKDIMAYVLFLYNFNDTLSFRRLVQNPKRGIGDKTVDNIFNAHGETFLDKINSSIATSSTAAMSKLQKLMTMLENAYSMDFKDIINYIIKEIGYNEYIKGYADEFEYDERLMNIKELIEMSQQYDTIGAFLEDCALIAPDDHVDDVQQVKLMTIHAAKGLEFKVVFVIGLEEGTLPHYRSLQEYKETRDDRYIEEERRLFYVACTRAANVLNVSRCTNRGWMKGLKKSRFINELDSDTYNDFNMMKSKG